MSSKNAVSSDQQIESLLKQLSLKEPSRSLDETVSEVCDSVWDRQRTSESVSSKPNRGWLPLVVAALAASIVGFVIGQFVTIDPNLGGRATSLAAVVSEVGNSSQVLQSSLTPVKFNVNAFKLLHGHSQLDEFASCKQCHTGDLDGTTESFKGWYYGDSEFFQKHVQSDVSKCSDCHKLESDQKPLPKFEHFKDSNCSTCHVVGKSGQKKPSI